MDIIAAYGLVGSYRGAAEMCGTTHRTVKKVVTEELARMSGQPLPARRVRVSNTQVVRDLVGQKVTASRGKISAKRLLPENARLIWLSPPCLGEFQRTSQRRERWRTSCDQGRTRRGPEDRLPLEGSGRSSCG